MMQLSAICIGNPKVYGGSITEIYGAKTTLTRDSCFVDRASLRDLENKSN
jgi:hypothetical protein